MSEPNFRMLVRNLRLMEDAKKAGKCHACGRKLLKVKPTALSESVSAPKARQGE